VTTLADRLASIDESIAREARAAGRDPNEITRIVVTKFHPVSLIEQLHELGVRAVGENRQQELAQKVPALSGLTDLQWHFIGQAQTNKAASIRRVADVVHSVDRVRIADALEKAASPDRALLDVLVQVNLTDDPGRGGVAPIELEALAEHIQNLLSLRLRGIMAVAPLEQEPSRAFDAVAGYSARLRSIVPDATWISAGMTADFPEAIRAGATHLRIGTAITGSRPDAG
jgi:pyridoxal phosphate enzyme (YggS family)